MIWWSLISNHGVANANHNLNFGFNTPTTCRRLLSCKYSFLWFLIDFFLFLGQMLRLKWNQKENLPSCHSCQMPQASYSQPKKSLFQCRPNPIILEYYINAEKKRMYLRHEKFVSYKKVVLMWFLKGITNSRKTNLKLLLSQNDLCT